MPFKAMGLACAVVVLSSPLASAQVNFDELFNTIAFSDEAPPPVPKSVLSQNATPKEAAPVTLSLGNPEVIQDIDEPDRRVDFGALLGDCEAAPKRLPTPESRELHGHHAPLAAACEPACGSRSEKDCKPCVTYYRATPLLERPNIPAPTSLDAYYRTPACYRDLWGGYHQQRMRECQCHHKHLHGHCKCLNPTPPHPSQASAPAAANHIR